MIPYIYLSCVLRRGKALPPERCRRTKAIAGKTVPDEQKSIHSPLIIELYRTMVYRALQDQLPPGGGGKFRARFYSRLGNPCKFARRSLHLNKRKAPLQISTKLCWNRLNNIYLFGPKLVSYIYYTNIALKYAKSALIKPCQSLRKPKPRQPFQQPVNPLKALSNTCKVLSRAYLTGSAIPLTATI